MIAAVRTYCFYRLVRVYTLYKEEWFTPARRVIPDGAYIPTVTDDAAHRTASAPARRVPQVESRTWTFG